MDLTARGGIGEHAGRTVDSISCPKSGPHVHGGPRSIGQELVSLEYLCVCVPGREELWEKCDFIPNCHFFCSHAFGMWVM